jgi:hypothetical protein
MAEISLAQVNQIVQGASTACPFCQAVPQVRAKGLTHVVFHEPDCFITIQNIMDCDYTDADRLIQIVQDDDLKYWERRA